MSFLRRLFGSDGDQARSEADVPSSTPAEVDAAERAYEADLLRAEQDRLDALRQRQLRYADHAWRPPAQGGERRADDEAERDG
ncbi:MAG: hypothetical protein ACLGIJ_05725 [Candidatus Limnocylindria bacterium]